MTDLKPCPFCDAEGFPHYMAAYDHLEWHCRHRGDDNWNTRPIEDRLRAALERIKMLTDTPGQWTAYDTRDARQTCEEALKCDRPDAGERQRLEEQQWQRDERTGDWDR